jgi:ribose transport system permease protein
MLKQAESNTRTNGGTNSARGASLDRAETSKDSRLPRWLRAHEIRILGVNLLVGVLLTFATPHFLNADNMTAVAIGFATDAIIAIAMTMILITGGFDLSVGAVLALGGMIAGICLHSGWNMWAAILCALLSGALIGAVNGLIITRIRVNPLITTLGMMSIVNSLTLVISGGYPLSSFPKAFLFIGQGFVFGIPFSVLTMIILVLVGDVLLRNARVLRLLYYVGSNENAAMLSGIPVRLVRFWVYVFGGLMAGLAGVIATSRLSSAFPLAGAGTEMRVISACVIGGASLAGGEGSILGSLLGVLLMGLINNGLVLLNVSTYWQGIVSGSILIAAVTFDILSRKKKGA